MKETQDIQFEGVTLDAATHPALAKGYTRLSGVDLRPTAGLRKFPGFLQRSFHQGTLYTTPTFLRYAEIQKTGTDSKLRGYVILDTSQTTAYLRYHYFDTNASSWNVFLIDSWTAANGGDQDDVDVATFGKFLYVVYKDDSGFLQKAVYYDSTDSAIRVDTLGVGLVEETLNSGITTTSTGGKLGPATYGTAFRYRHKRRGTRTGMSQVQSQVVSATGTANKLTYTSSGNNEFDKPTDWDTDETEVEMYRTVGDGGRLRFERKFDWTDPTVSATEWEWGSSGTTPQGLSDTELVQQDLYEPLLEVVGLPPSTNRITNYQGSTIMRLDGTDSDVNDIVHSNTDLVFSPAHATRPEDFPRDQVYRVPTSVGPVLQFVEAGDYLVALTPVAAIRFQKNGTQMAVNTFHFGWGPSSRSGAVAVGSSVLVVTTKGVYVLNAADGEIQLLEAISRFITHEDNWVQDIEDDLESSGAPNIHCSHDEALGCVFIANNSKKQCLCLWTATGRISLLDDFAWTLSTSGPDPISGGARRAWFWAPNGSGSVDDTSLLHVADHTRNATNDGVHLPTLWGFGDGTTVNGTYSSVSGSAMSLIRDNGSSSFLPENVAGSYAHLWFSGDSTRERAVVTRLGTAIDEDNFDRAANATVDGSNWAEFTETGGVIEIGDVTASVDRYEVQFEAATSAENAQHLTNLNGYSTVEPYLVSALFRCHDLATAAPVYLLSAERAATNWSADKEGYLICWNPTASNITMNGETVNADSIEVFRVTSAGSYTSVGTSDLSTTPFAAASYKTHRPYRLSSRVERSGSDTTFRVFINESQVAFITDSAQQFSSSPWYAGVGVKIAAGTSVPVYVDEFRFIGNLDELTLSAATTGTQAAGDRYSLSPVPTLVTLPPYGVGGLFNRTQITQQGGYLKNLQNPQNNGGSANSYLRFQVFTEGGTTEETNQEVTLTADAWDLFGHTQGAGLVVQGGFEHHGSGEDFELLSMRILGILGDTTEDA